MTELFHTCRLADLPSIRKHGLLCEMARSKKRKAVWLHSRERMMWARLHLEEKLGGLEAGICVIKVRVDDEASLTRYAEGVYYSKTDIDPACFVAIRKYTLKMEKVD